jgi:formate dehydrogenase alpha subunit
MTNSIADLATSNVIFVIGSNTTDAHPIIALHVKQAKSRGAKIIVADPRKTRMTLWADNWVRQRPGTDVALVNGMMNAILTEGLEASDFIRERTEGIDELKAAVEAWTPERASEVCGVAADDIREIARMYAGAERASILYAMGITQHAHGVDNVYCMADLAMLAGQVGRPGTGVNPLRGQNNVQGACDAGALFNFYPGYAKTDDPAAKERFETAWGVGLSDRPGLSVVEMMNAAHAGEVKAMLVMGENPMLSDPDLEHVRESLEALDFLVVQDIFMTETSQMADVVLPAASFAEKTGTFTNTERKVQLLRKAIPSPGQARDDLWIVNEIARALHSAEAEGARHLHPSVTSDDPFEVMAEMAGVIVQYAGISCERLEDGGIPWPCPSHDHPGTPILHADKFSRGLGRFMPVEYRPPAEEPDDEFPLVLTTGRLLEQYHTGTMSRRGIGIDEVAPPRYVDINTEDAARLGVAAEDEVTVATRRGQVAARANVTDSVAPGVIYMPFHFAEAPANALTISVLDPIAKIPELKVCAARVTKAD